MSLVKEVKEDITVQPSGHGQYKVSIDLTEYYTYTENMGLIDDLHNENEIIQEMAARSLLFHVLIDNNIEMETYKDSKASNVEQLHSDTSRYITDDIDKQNIKFEFKDWDIVTPEEYNKTLYANCGEKQPENEPVAVFLLD